MGCSFSPGAKSESEKQERGWGEVAVIINQTGLALGYKVAILASLLRQDTDRPLLNRSLISLVYFHILGLKKNFKEKSCQASAFRNLIAR